MLICSSCGQPNPDGARFCNACAAPLAVAKRREERKVVTVLFADLVGFTGHAEQLDPEDVKAILQPYHERLRSELERFGGTVEKFIGDAVMAVFGAPLTHEDDPERAVRAALAIRDWAQEEGVEVRVAANTGEALVSIGARPEAGEGMVAGDVVNTTARLQTAAPINGVLVGETTYRATDHVIEYSPASPVEAKGKTAPIVAWEALGARSRLGIDVIREARTPFVGREHELDILLGTFERVRRESTSQLVTLVGVPGIGKSRLVYELSNRVRRGPDLTYWRQGRSLPYGDGVTFWALGEMMKAHAGIFETDAPEQVREKLAHALGMLFEDDGEFRWVESHVRPLVGLTVEDELGRERRAEAFGAWRRVFAAMAAQRPLVLVFEDLHWADDGLLDFVDHLVDWAGGVPMIVICTARPELLERRPGWGGGKLNSTTLAVSPLSDPETAELIAALVAGPDLVADAPPELLARASGNPLYAEQYARILAERPDDLLPPETVHGIIAARLDLLTPDEKTLLHAAAVLGKVFWLGAVAAVADVDRAKAEERLHGLERKEFVQKTLRASVAGESEYSFRHLLVRDVAYEQIPRAERATWHQAAAEWIESLARPEDHAEMVAHHYVSALELARAAGRATPDAEARARDALREAGDRASMLNAHDAAGRYYDAALELWPRDDRERPRLLFHLARARFLNNEPADELLRRARDALLNVRERELAAEAEAMLGELSYLNGWREPAFHHLRSAAVLLETEADSPSKAYVLSRVARSYMLAQENERTIEVARQALDMAGRLGLDEVRAHVLNTLGSARVNLGDEAGLADIEQSIELAHAIGSPESGRGYTNLGASLLTLGRARRTAEVWAEGWRVAERFGDIAGFTWLNRLRVDYFFFTGHWDEALAAAEDLVAQAEAGTPLYQEVDGRMVRGLIRLGREDSDGALLDVVRAIEVGRAAVDPQSLDPALGVAAFVFLSVGRAADAEALADELLASGAVSRRMGHHCSPPYFLAWVLSALDRGADLLTASARVENPTPWLEAATAIASNDLARAADLYAEIGMVPNEAYTRLRAAERLVHHGQRAEADAQLQHALAFYRSVGATRYVREGEALLAASV